MHVCMTADTVGGVWTYARELCSELLERGHEITLVTLGRKLSPSQRAWTESASTDYSGAFRCLATEYKLEWMQESEADIATSIKWLRDVIHDSSPDLLHLNQFCYAVIESECPRMVVAHSDVVSWWQAVHGKDPERSDWFEHYYRVVSQGLRSAERVIAPTQWMADEMRRYYRFPAEMSVIWNGVRGPEKPSRHAKQRQAATIGRCWDGGKNLGILEHLHAPLPILVAGELEEPHRVTHNSCPSFAPEIALLGSLGPDQVDALLEQSAIYIVPSKYEPFGLAAVEAALRGCALVLSDLPSLRELWGDVAVYFDPHVPASLEDSLYELIGDEARLHDMQHAARSRAETTFTVSRMADDYCAWYEDMLAAAGVAR